MIEIETALRQGLETLAAETASVVTPPSVGSIKLRARRDQAQNRRWPKIVTGIAVGMVVTTGAAAAVGVLPAPVESMLSEFRSWGFGANQGAERMASVTDGDLTYEVWQAPLDGGGNCVYDRVIGPDGDVSHGGASQCISEAEPRTTDRFGHLHYPEPVYDNSTGGRPGARQHSVSSGQLPLGATEAVFEFDDGTTLEVAAQREGYFITTFPHVRDGVRIVRVTAVDTEGHIVASQVAGQ
jgi:hypothetical protein